MLRNTDESEDIVPSQLATWIQRTKEGHQESFSPIYDMFIRDIYRFVFFKVKEEDTEDITAEIFIKAWEKIHSFSGTEEKFKSWLFTIAQHTIIDYYRTRKIVVSIDEALEVKDDETPDMPLEEHINDTLIQDALQKIPEPGKSIVILKYMQELSNEEIAQILSIKEGNVRTIAHRSLKRLKELLLELRSHLP